MENVAKLLITMQSARTRSIMCKFTDAGTCHITKATHCSPPHPIIARWGASSAWQRVCRVVGNLRLPCAQSRPGHAAPRLALTAQLSCVRIAFATRGNAAILCFALLWHQAQTMSIGYTLGLDRESQSCTV